MEKTSPDAFGPELPIEYREQVAQQMARAAFVPRMMQYAGNALVQAIMLCIFLPLPGGPFLHARRAGYVCLYSTLLLCAVLCGVLLLRNRRKTAAVQNRIQTVYAAVVCAWSCGICVLDTLGDGSVTVFCYMLPSVAALSVLSLRRSAILLSGAEVLLLALLLVVPGGREELFNAAVNSLCTVSIAILIAGWQYTARCQSVYRGLLLERAAVTDSLTGLYNRRYMDTELADALAQSGDPAGILVDIDRFKEYNDSRGHRAGDECLSRIAGRIMELAEGKPICVVRYGGEELFLCCLEEGRDAPALGERIRREVEAMGLEGHHGRPVTVSVGVYIHGPGPAELDGLIRRADAALYRAKAAGRNALVVDDGRDD